MKVYTNPVDFFNQNISWSDILSGIKDLEWISKESICNQKLKKESFKVKNELLLITGDNQLKLTIGDTLTKFEFITFYQFKNNYRSALSYIEYKYMNHEVPYIRVGTDYFKIFSKTDRYGVSRKIIKGWKKDEIKQDNGPDALKRIHLFDDFCIAPNNINYQLIHDNCYNLYSPFSHLAHNKPVSKNDIPTSLNMMHHIFGDKINEGLIYLKVLYLHPEVMLPILCLVSTERETGKTTFLNWMQIIFGDNYVQINPEDITSSFNSSYASKNIIALDETVIEKSHAVEKIKSLATTKSISVNQKFVANYSLPFFGKLIICTNKEKDFMRIDEEEIRFWVRKINTIKNKNTKIEESLKEEIPKFLRYLYDLPEVDFSKSRMVLTAEQIASDSLTVVKKESWSWLKKELFIFVADFFNQNPSLRNFKAAPIDIKRLWFSNDRATTNAYISKVINDELKLTQLEMCRYSPFADDPISTKTGKPYLFDRNYFQTESIPETVQEEIPF